MDLSQWAYLLVIVIAWLAAHIIKLILSLIMNKKQDGSFFRSGGMPSAHSATIVSVSVLIGLLEGFDSAIFAVAVAISLIVMHDAVRVRRATGENGVAIKSLIAEQGSRVSVPRIVRGHTVPEVVVGALLGAVISLVVFLATN
jgi:acid phosphatase family membrane protein YuiD